MVGSRPVERILGILTAAALGVDAYVHFADAGSYGAVTSSVVSEATLVRVQAAAARTRMVRGRRRAADGCVSIELPSG